jgi:hypothetical protein
MTEIDRPTKWTKMPRGDLRDAARSGSKKPIRTRHRSLDASSAPELGDSMTRMLQPTALLFALLLLPGASLAQTSAQLAATSGLLGAWQVQCGVPGMENPLYVYRTVGSRVELDRDYGGNLRDTNVVSGVKLGPRGEISCMVTFPRTDPPQSREHVWIRAPGGRQMRIYANRDVDTGQYSVRDGRHMNNGAVTLWMSRCY